MTHEEFVAIRKELGLSIRALSKILVRDPAGICRWEKKKRPVPKLIARKMLELLEEKKPTEE